MFKVSAHIRWYKWNNKEIGWFQICSNGENKGQTIFKISLYIVLFAFNNEELSDLSKLMDIGGTFLASSVDCERGFSLMNSNKNKSKNRLDESHFDMLMRIKTYQLGGGVMDLNKV